MTNLGKIALIAATVSFGSPAFAQDWYGTFGIGLSTSPDDVFNDGTNGAGNPQASIDNSTSFSAGVGWAMNDDWKFELAYSRTSFDTDASALAGTGIRAADTFNTDANLDIDTLMLSAAYQIPTNTQFKPYVKAGVGAAFYDISGALTVSSFGGDDFGGMLPATFQYDGDGTEFAYQIGAGVAFDIAENAELTVEYLYGDYGQVATDFDSNGDRLQTDLTSSNINVGVRYFFN